MAAIGKKGSSSGSVKRVSPLKPGLRDARNWASAQMRAASHTKRGLFRATFSIFLVLLSLVFIALWLGGFLPDVRRAGDNFTRSQLMSMGFVVDRVDVMGEGRLRENDVRLALGVQPGDYFFGIDLESAQNRVEGLSWVDHAVVRRLWPDRVVVQIIERQPYALWQNDGQIKVVDIKGNEITDAKASDFAGLTVFTGHGAANNTQEIHKLMVNFESIYSRAEAFVYVGGRWDILMADGSMRVKLPAKDPAKALRRLRDLNERTQILDRKVAVIDLRIADRISLSPSSDKRA